MQTVLKGIIDKLFAKLETLKTTAPMAELITMAIDMRDGLFDAAKEGPVRAPVELVYDCQEFTRFIVMANQKAQRILNHIEYTDKMIEDEIYEAIYVSKDMVEMRENILKNHPEVARETITNFIA